MATEIKILSVVEEDIPAIQSIYAYHVLNGLGTFEEIPPTIEEMTERYSKITTAGFPYLVAKLHDKVVGYAYAGHFRERSAYKFTVEDSIYVDPEYAGNQIGSLLLQELIQLSKVHGFKQMFALIGDSNNWGSIKLHERHSFERVGVMKNAGYKFGKFVDVVIMQLNLE